METKQKKDQFVVAYLTCLDDTDTVISHALFLSKILNKGLILLYICDKNYTSVTPEEAQLKLEQIKSSIIGADVSYCALQNKTKEVINVLPTLLNAVVVVAEVKKEAKRRTPTHAKELLKNFSECKIAYLTVQEPLQKTTFDHVGMSIDFKKESKEKLVWASYYARFAHSQVHALYNDYKDEGLKTKWYSNMKFLAKFFDSLQISFIPHIIPNKSTYLDVNALEYASQQNYDLMVCVTTKDKDALEFFIGVQEERIIVNSAHIPILFLNPREDLYVLCD